MPCEKDRIKPITMTKLRSPDESPPRSGTQTPAACRPLLRRSQDIHTWPNFRLSDFTYPDNLREENMLASAMASPTKRDRSLSYNALSHLKNVQEEYEGDAFTPKRTKHGPSAASPFRPRPPPLLRRVSHEVREREQNLQKEVETLRCQLETQEEKKRTESLLVEFVFNRMLEQQRNQMAVQQQLLDKLVSMDLRGKELPATFSSRKSE